MQTFFFATLFDSTFVSVHTVIEERECFQDKIAKYLYKTSKRAKPTLRLRIPLFTMFNVLKRNIVIETQFVLISTNCF